MDAKAVDFISCTVSDLETSVEFYRDTLGLSLEYHNDEIGWAEFGTRPTTIALGEANEGVPLTPGDGGVTIALAVDDIESALAELRDAGHDIKMDFVDTGVCDMAMVADPDGNPIMLHRRHDGTSGRKNPFDEDE